MEKIHITLDVAQECIQKRVVRYDKTGDNHYDTISAFIKSLRGSDPDAAVYYLAKCSMRGRYQIHCPTNYDFCVGRCGECRPECIDGSSFGGTGSREGLVCRKRIVLLRQSPTSHRHQKSNAAYLLRWCRTWKCENYKTTVPAHLQIRITKEPQNWDTG